MKHKIDITWAIVTFLYSIVLCALAFAVIYNKNIETTNLLIILFIVIYTFDRAVESLNKIFIRDGDKSERQK